MALPARRMLNALWRFLTENATAEQRADMEAAMTRAEALFDADMHPMRGTAAHTTTYATVPARPMPGPDPNHIPGTAPRHIRPPSWWKGDRAAYASTVAAAEQLGEPAAKLAKVV